MIEKVKSNKEIERIIKYIFSAGSSFVLDVGLFTLFHFLFIKSTDSLKETTIIFISTITARVISSIYNYFINSRVVFKNKGIRKVIGYFLLVIIQMLVSASLVSLVKHLISTNTTLIKIVIDIIIFVVNYIVQKEVIFK